MSLAAGDDMASRPATAVVSAIADITSSGYHLLAVDGYSAIKGSTPNGKSVLSHPFIVGGYRWRIGFYPNGSNRENAGNISLSLVLDEGDIVTIEPLKVRYLFSFLDQVEKHVSSRVLAREVREFTSHNPRWVSKAFMTREAFEQSKHLMGDSFTIRCDIVITKNGNAASGAPPPLSVAVPPPDIQQHLLSLLRSGKGTDVTFEVGGETIAAHRLVLAARSSVFAAELLDPMEEGSTTTSGAICIQGMNAQVFRLLLDFIYSDSVPEVEEEEEGEKQDEAWQNLLAAASRYRLERLRLMCEEKLSGYINASTVARTLALAEQHCCRGLKEACLDFLRSPENMQQVMASGGLQFLTRTCPSVLKEVIAKLLG
jgi:speckle-type POZ protein